MREDRAYYNEIDPYCCAWLSNLMDAGHITPGVIDDRSIWDVCPDDVRQFDRAHFFAGIGGWELALNLAGWGNGLVWTGSAPCQPFSQAGQGLSFADERHLWPAWHWLIQECRPGVVFGEQVDAAIGRSWLDLVSTDLEGIGYAIGPVVLPAAGVGAPHARHRLWFVADRDGESRAQGRPVNSGRNQESNAQPWAGPCGGGVSGDMGNSDTTRLAGRGELWDRSDRIKAGAPGVADGGGMGQPDGNGRLARSPSATPAGHRGAAESAGSGAWSDVEWLTCIDGKQRPTQRGIRPLADGSTGRVGQLRAYGNAIVPQVAAEVIGSYMDMSA